MPRRRVFAQEFIDQVLRALPSESCVEWPGARFPHGYGRLASNGAHREIYRRVVGDIPPGLQLDHLCRNRACVNPAHLELVTRRENILRGAAPSASNAKKTHCLNGHPFDEANTYIRQDRPQRGCRACLRERQRRYQASLKAGV